MSKQSGLVSPDIDECARNLSKCVENAYCNNLIPSYECHCDVGFSGDGFTSCIGNSEVCEPIS